MTFCGSVERKLELQFLKFVALPLDFSPSNSENIPRYAALPGHRFRPKRN
jgi:hypothetical protein